MTVKDLIGSRADVYSIPHDMTVHDAARYLRERQVRSVGVLDGSRLVARRHRPGPRIRSARQVNDTQPGRVAALIERMVSDIEEPVIALLGMAYKADVDDARESPSARIYHLLVVDQSHAYRGMLSVTDLLSVIASDEKARADMLEAFLFERTPSS